MTPIREKIALRIKELGITKKTLCDDLGLTQQNFSTFLTGKRPCPLDDLEKVLMYLGLTVQGKDYKPTGDAAPQKVTVVTPESHYALLRQKIRIRIGQSGIPQPVVASRAHVNEKSLSSFLTGKRGLNITHIESLMEVLDITLVQKPGFVFQRAVRSPEDSPEAEAGGN